MIFGVATIACAGDRNPRHVVLAPLLARSFVRSDGASETTLADRPLEVRTFFL